MGVRAPILRPVTVGISEAAARVGADDVFVLRRVTGRRFVHLGGVGRGEGWAGIVEVAIDDEKPLADALDGEQIVRLENGGREFIFGPYYAHAVAIVPVIPDVVVVFGSPDGTIDADDATLSDAAGAAAAAAGPVGPAKRLADEYELLEAVRRAVAVPPTPVADAAASIAGIAAESLSCEFGALYLAETDTLVIAERGYSLSITEDELRTTLKDFLWRRDFPYCIQDAGTTPLPGALAKEAGIRSYYLLELTGAAEGVLLVVHTDAAPRGFTILCRALGERIAQVASAVLGVGLTREWTGAEAARLQAAFGELES